MNKSSLAKKVFISLFLFGFLLTPAFAQSEDEALRLFKQGQEASEYGRYQEALGYFERSLKINRSLNHLQGISGNLNNIGEVYYSLGRYEKAFSYFEESLKINKQLNIPQEIATSLNNIGLVYRSLGRYEKALSFYEESLKIYRQFDIPEYIATSLNNIGEVYYSLGQYDKALSYYEESLKIRRKLNIPQDIAASLNNIGLVYRSLGRYEKALAYFEESLKIIRQLNIPQYIVRTLNNIGLVYCSLGRYERALSYFEESLKIMRKNNLSPQDIAVSLNNIGGVYLTLKDYKKAEGLIKEGGGKEGLVELYIATVRHEEALKLLKDMTPEWNADDPSRIQFYTQHGMALKGVGRFKEASSGLLKAVLLLEEMRQTVKERGGFFAGGGFAGGRIRAYRGIISALSERTIKGERVDEEFKFHGKDLAASAFYFSESIKARSLLEAMAISAKKHAKTELPPDIKKKEEDILNQLSAIENQWEDTYKKGEEAFKNLIVRKETLKKELDSLIAVMRKDYPLYVALHYPKPIPAEELPLKENEVLVEYAITDDASYAFVVRKGGVKNLFKIPLSKEALEEKVKAFMEPLNTGKRVQFSVKAARELYDILLAETLKGIKETEKIIIIPDGILGVLPFEALVINEGKGFKDSLYVGDRWTLTYSQSATALALNRMLKPSQAKKPLFALGNPVYDKDDPRYIAFKKGQSHPVLLAQNTGSYAYRGITIKPKEIKITDGKSDIKWEEAVYSPLPETEIEVKEIAKFFNTKSESPDILLNMTANETTLRKAQLKDYRYLHFATHADLPGKVQGINEPFLLLGQVENENKDDGFLTMSEVLDMKLDADMAVLSACVTGKGKLVEGEGVANFARAFQHAGARSVVVSLWEVPSKETVEYMKIFYSYIKDGKSRAEALRLARNAIKAKYPNPFYWAPFILHGEG